MRNNFKTLFLVLLMTTFLFTLAACGGGVEESSKNEPTVSNEKAKETSNSSEPKEQYPNFPEREVKIIVSNKAGGSNDLSARSIAGPLQDVLGVPVVVENVNGAGGNVARAQVFKTEPDGYTLMHTPIPSMTIGELVAGGDFKTMDFEPVFNMFGKTSNVFIVPAESPFESIQDLIDASKNKKLTASGSGTATNAALGSIFLDEIGVNHQYVPFNGGSEAAQQVAGGHVDFGIASEIAAQSLADEGLVRVIGTTASERLELFPDVSTIVELGYPDLGFEILYGLWAPPGTPQEIIDKLAAAFLEASKDPAFKEAAIRAGFMEEILMPKEFKAKRDANYKVIGKLKEKFEAGK